MEAEPPEVHGQSSEERDERVRGDRRRRQGDGRPGRRRTGTTYHYTFTAKYDGKDNPVTGTSPFGDTVALTRVNPNTVQTTVKQGGKTTVTQTIVVAPDGKTRTTTTKGTDAKGQAIEGMSFYEKQ